MLNFTYIYTHTPLEVSSLLTHNYSNIYILLINYIATSKVVITRSNGIDPQAQSRVHERETV